MTVRDLKAFLATVPDDYLIVSADREGGIEDDVTPLLCHLPPGLPKYSDVSELRCISYPWVAATYDAGRYPLNALFF